jgi:hypothetical protein
MRRVARGAATGGATLGLALLLALFPPAPARAQALDPTASEALATTLRMLLDPAQRSAAIAGSPQAGAIDQQIRALTGSDALAQELFALAADVFQELTQASGGDPAKMTDALARGRTDSPGFAAALSPRTLERLRQLSIKISDQRR